MKLSILILFVVVIGFIFLDSPAPKPTPRTEDTRKAIALVKYRDTIHHCYMVQKRSCGYTLRCNGRLWERCAQIEAIEWLK